MKTLARIPKAVIFDMDGTITRPYLDFARIKREIGAGDGPILEFLATLKGEALRAAREKVDAWEEEGAQASELNPGVRELLAFLKTRRVPVAILTRNTRASVNTVLQKHSLAFDAIVTADDDLPPKPSPEPVRHLAQALGVPPRDVLVVGDFRFDIESGRSAGAMTAFLRTTQADDGGAGADFAFDRIGDVLDLLHDTP
jgi:HAD superfamily hydrolase (TIGR01509 family)